ncbi:MAG: hypothetical protein Q4G44_04180 [Alcaligenaceae bacterium]|nr:hypothetical protein [Alcaligenaceae bacterium]
MNYRLILLIATLLPMFFYYLLLALVPTMLATHVVLGIPASIFWGVAVMFWGVLMAIVYLIYHRSKTEDQ